MKLIASPVENLFKPVKTVSGIVERNQSLPVISNILIEQKDESVTFWTTDLDIQIRTSAPVGVSGAEGTFTVSAQKTSEILAALRPLDVVEIDVGEDGLAAFSVSGGALPFKRFRRRTSRSLKPRLRSARLHCPPKPFAIF